MEADAASLEFLRFTCEEETSRSWELSGKTGAIFSSQKLRFTGCWRRQRRRPTTATLLLATTENFTIPQILFLLLSMVCCELMLQ